MARRQKHEEHENHERWLVSYADFITLLFAFFVVMYAISSVNEGKYRVMSDSIEGAFKNTPSSDKVIVIPGPSPQGTQNGKIQIDPVAIKPNQAEIERQNRRDSRQPVGCDGIPGQGRAGQGDREQSRHFHRNQRQPAV